MPVMPLASVSSYPYRQIALEIGTRDVVVVLNNGFPENAITGKDEPSAFGVSNV